MLGNSGLASASSVCPSSSSKALGEVERAGVLGLRAAVLVLSELARLVFYSRPHLTQSDGKAEGGPFRKHHSIRVCHCFLRTVVKVIMTHSNADEVKGNPVPSEIAHRITEVSMSIY